MSMYRCKIFLLGRFLAQIAGGDMLVVEEGISGLNERV